MGHDTRVRGRLGCVSSRSSLITHLSVARRLLRGGYFTHERMDAHGAAAMGGARLGRLLLTRWCNQQKRFQQGKGEGDGEGEGEGGDDEDEGEGEGAGEGEGTMRARSQPA